MQAIVLFVLLLIYFSSSKTRDANDWVRALVLAGGLTVFGLLPGYLGVIGWIIAVVASVALISKVIGQSIVGSTLFLIVIGFVQYVVMVVLQKVM